MAFSSIYGIGGSSDFLEDGQDLEDGEQEFVEDADLEVDVALVSEEIVGTNLKELIEQEFNSEA